MSRNNNPEHVKAHDFMKSFEDPLSFFYQQCQKARHVLCSSVCDNFQLLRISPRKEIDMGGLFKQLIQALSSRTSIA